jgi:hypothetical protein
MDPDLDLAQAFAPLVRVGATDPSADPAIWLGHADLVAYPETGNPATISPAVAVEAWPTDVRERLVRPHDGDSAGGYAFVPRTRAPKLLWGEPATATLPDGRSWPVGGEVRAPCFYEVEELPGAKRLTYWFFFPTSTTPANDFARMVPALIDLLRKGTLPPDAFPPMVNQVSIPARLRPWYWLESRFPLVKDVLGDPARRAGGGFTALAMVPWQLLDRDTQAFIGQLDPLEQERIASLYVHEGDWEGISVEVSTPGVLQRVIYWGHGHPVTLKASQVPTEPHQGMPRLTVLTAIGSHASMPPASGSVTASPNVLQRLQEEVLPGDDAVVWKTWTDLRPVRAQPWYGFGGAWGRPRLAPLGTLDQRRLHQFDLWREATGPLGPSRLKLSKNRESLERS